MKNPAEVWSGGTSGGVRALRVGWDIREGTHLTSPISGGSCDSVKQDPAGGLVRACPAGLGDDRARHLSDERSPRHIQHAVMVLQQHNTQHLFAWIKRRRPNSA